MPLWCSSPLKHTTLVEFYRPLLTGPFGCAQRWRCEPPSPQLGCYCSSVPLLHFLSEEKIVFIIFLKLARSWISMFQQQHRSPQDKSHVQNDFTPVENTKSQVSLTVMLQNHPFKMILHQLKTQNHKSH